MSQRTHSTDEAGTQPRVPASFSSDTSADRPPHTRRKHCSHAATARRARRQTNAQLPKHLSHNHLLTQFFTILREVTTKWFT